MARCNIADNTVVNLPCVSDTLSPVDDDVDIYRSYWGIVSANDTLLTFAMCIFQCRRLDWMFSDVLLAVNGSVIV